LFLFHIFICHVVLTQYVILRSAKVGVKLEKFEALVEITFGIMVV